MMIVEALPVFAIRLPHAGHLGYSAIDVELGPLLLQIAQGANERSRCFVAERHPLAPAVDQLEDIAATVVDGLDDSVTVLIDVVSVDAGATHR
jgi:hypothetical protein